MAVIPTLLNFILRAFDAFARLQVQLFCPLVVVGLFDEFKREESSMIVMKVLSCFGISILFYLFSTFSTWFKDVFCIPVSRDVCHIGLIRK